MKLYKNLNSARQEADEVQALKVTIKTDQFPEELLDFPNLTELYFEGHCAIFPKDVSGWEKLKVLSIKWPKFTGDLSPLFHLRNLENLKVIETPLKTFILPLGYAVAPLKSLTIKDCGLVALPEEISDLTHLEEMNLSGNNLSTLPFSFTELKHLKRLNLDNNQFTKFPDLVKKMANLSHLSIDQNKFSEEEKERVQREFHIWPS